MGEQGAAAGGTGTQHRTGQLCSGALQGAADVRALTPPTVVVMPGRPRLGRARVLEVVAAGRLPEPVQQRSTRHMRPNRPMLENRIGDIAFIKR